MKKIEADLIGRNETEHTNILVTSEETLRNSGCDLSLLSLPCIRQSLFDRIGEILTVKIDGYSFKFDDIKVIDDTSFGQEIEKIPGSNTDIGGVFPPKSSEELFVKEEGKIYITVGMDLQPFFDDDFQKEFQFLRNSKEWVDFIGFKEKFFNERSKKEEPTLKSRVEEFKSGYAEWDKEERELEKKGYDMEVFRGSLYNDFFSPIYKIDKDKLSEKLEKEKEKHKEDKPYMVDFLEKLKNLEWKIKIRFSRSGLVSLFLEKEIKEGVLVEKTKEGEELKKPTKLTDYIQEVSEILKDPYSEEIDLIKEEIKKVEEVIDELRSILPPDAKSLLEEWQEDPQTALEQLQKIENIVKSLLPEERRDNYDKIIKFLKEYDTLKDSSNTLETIQIVAGKEQNFDSYLWILSVYATHFFLKEYIERTKNWKLKEPPDISYMKGSHYENQPIVRNYFIIYHLPANIEGLVINEKDKFIFNLKDHFSCPGRKENCPKVQTKKVCFIKEFGNQFYSLGEFAVIEKEGKIVWPCISLERIEQLSNIDLSSWEGELCLLNGMVGVICYQNYDRVLKFGRYDEYESYWRCIIKGLGFFMFVKTGCQIVERELYDASYRMRTIEMGKTKEEIDKFREKIIILGNIINERLRIAANPYSISRADYAIIKFKRFVELLGIKDILASIEASFEEVNRGITHYYEAKRAKDLKNLTWIVGIFTTIIAVGTVMLVVIEPTYHFWLAKLLKTIFNLLGL